MTRASATSSGLFRRLLTATALTGLVFGVGCSDDDENKNNNMPTPTSSFYGAFIGSGDAGTMSVTISTTTLAPRLRAAKLNWGAGGSRVLGAGTFAAHDVGASGSIDLDGGAVIGLTGTYNEESDSLNLAGGGYTFFGAYDTTGSISAITGGYMNGTGGVGFFGVLLNGAANGTQVLCGSFVDVSETVAGRLNLLVFGDDVGGAAFADGDPEGVGFEGTVTGTGNPKTITLAGGDGGNTFSGTGTWDTTTNMVTGTWEISDMSGPVDSGTWEASTCD